jgi:hypothetical protein
MDAASLAVIVGPVTTLLGGLGGYWLAGRNEEARDQRAAAREAAARRDALAERLEEDRHTFQRDTLLELQDELQRLVRNAGKISLQDQRTIKEEGQIYLLGGTLSDENMQIMVAIARLRARVLDDQLRSAVGDFTSLCAGASMGLDHPRDKVSDQERGQAVRKLQDSLVRLTVAYEELNDLLGIHLRRELDRRDLAVPPSPEGSR